jgi:ABC-type uncharacterized transport system involved in gliding motility auxiliary subunit
VEELTVNRNLISQILGAAALGLLLVGASLFTVRASNQTLTGTLLVIGAALLLAYIIVNLRLISGFFRKRSSRYGANMVVMIILFTGILIIIQTVSIRHRLRYDLTENKRFSLAEQSINVLKGLEKDIRVVAFYKKTAPDRTYAQDLIGQFAHKSERVVFEFIDPDQKPQSAKDMGITTYGTTVVQCGPRTQLITDITEEKLTNAILKASRDEIKSVYFAQGHAEKNPDGEDEFGYSIAKDAIERENYAVRTISILQEKTVPDDCFILIIAGPMDDYFDSEIEKIRAYLAKGGNAIFLLDPRISFPNIGRLLADYRVVLDDDVIIDTISRIFGSDVTVPVVNQYEAHPITRGFDVVTFFPMARSVRIAEKEVPGVNAQYLALTGKSAWGETDLEGVRKGKVTKSAEDLAPPLPVALIASKSYAGGVRDSTQAPESKIVVFGDSDFADNSSFRVSGNSDLFLNVVNFLAEEKDLIAIRAKQGMGDRILLTASQGRLIFLISVVLLPLSVIGFGTSVFIRNRRRG